MKFGCCFSIFAFLLLPFSNASNSNCHEHKERLLPFDNTFSVAELKYYFENVVDLSTRLSQEEGNHPYGQCPNGCIIYVCTKEDDTVIISGGCPEDMYRDCKSFKEKDMYERNQIEYDLRFSSSKNASENNLVYFYGCDDGFRDDQRKCIEKKFLKFIHDASKSKPHRSESSYDSFEERRNQPIGMRDWDEMDEFYYRSGAYQNGYTMKFIGIIIFGWIFTAAWIF